MKMMNWPELLPEWTLLDGRPWNFGESDCDDRPVEEVAAVLIHHPDINRKKYAAESLLRRTKFAAEEFDDAEAEEKVVEACALGLRMVTQRHQTLLDYCGPLLRWLSGKNTLQEAVKHYSLDGIRVRGNKLTTSEGHKLSLDAPPYGTGSARRARGSRNLRYHKS